LNDARSPASCTTDTDSRDASLVASPADFSMAPNPPAASSAAPLLIPALDADCSANSLMTPTDLPKMTLTWFWASDSVVAASMMNLDAATAAAPAAAYPSGITEPNADLNPADTFDTPPCIRVWPASICRWAASARAASAV
jgi:hypothetical protein